MAVYHQVGHDSENLLHAENLEAYGGAILSPVNYRQERVAAQIQRARLAGDFETVFDPQLYVPNSDRGFLSSWEYFPKDVDTADLTSTEWWMGLVNRIGTLCSTLRPAAVCSPAILPSIYSDDFFLQAVQTGSELCAVLSGSGVEVVQSAIVSLTELAAPGRAETIASILSRTKARRIYLVLVGLVEPRRELAEVEELKGGMRLIAALERSGLRVLVGFCSSDVVLWKAAGATDCATGKFFNLRRFTRTRFEEPRGGGGQLPYWYEESLMAFLRESDLLRVLPLGLARLPSSPNPFGNEILAQLEAHPGTAWLALAWRQFLYWFADIEGRIAAEALEVGQLLQMAENNWTTLDDAGVLMEERRNEGKWLRAWRRAVMEFRG
jgi:hypothetical protein